MLRIINNVANEMMQIKNILSIQNILEKTKQTVFRFPLAFADALIGTGIGIYLIDGKNEEILGKALLVSIIGFFLFLGTAIFAEEKKISKIYSNLVAAIILVSYYLLMPQKFSDYREIHGVKTFLLSLIFILFISLAPFFKKEVSCGFWHYNKKLLLRLAFTFISSLTLYAGIALSLASLEFLFGFEIDWKWYEQLNVLIIGVVATMVFMAGVPKNYQELEMESDYPKVIKIFSQYILVPLTVLYFFILYAYGAKIILTQNWPNGNVVYLILIFSFFVIATMLLLYPERETLNWVKKISNFFYVALIPLVLLLFGAVYMRIVDYGFTPERCAVIIFGFWLLGISGYFISTKKYDIRVIFATMLVLLVVFSFGLWNVFSISSASQIGRLKKILTEKDILVGGKISKNESVSITRKEYNQITSILDVIYSNNAISEIQPWFGQKINLKNESNYWDMQEKVIKEMGINNDKIIEDYDGPFKDFDDGQDAGRLTSKNQESHAISGFDYFFQFYSSNKDGVPVSINGEELIFFTEDAKIVIKNKINNEKANIILEKDLTEVISNLLERKRGQDREDIPHEEMIVVMENNQFLIKMEIDDMRVHKDDGKFIIDDIDAVTLIKIKR